MKQKFIVPEYVDKNVKLILDRNRESLLVSTQLIDCSIKEWIFKLPSGTWFISEQNFVTGEIILCNGLNDTQDKFEYEDIDLSYDQNLEQFLNKKGNEGWELITLNLMEKQNKLILKRKII
jgi:hypothetical protein